MTGRLHPQPTPQQTSHAERVVARDSTPEELIGSAKPVSKMRNLKYYCDAGQPPCITIESQPITFM